MTADKGEVATKQRTCSVALREAPELADTVEELATLDKLRHDVHSVGCADGIQQLHDVGVLGTAQHVYFRFQPAALAAAAVDALHCNAAVGAVDELSFKHLLYAVGRVRVAGGAWQQVRVESVVVLATGFPSYSQSAHRARSG